MKKKLYLLLILPLLCVCINFINAAEVAKKTVKTVTISSSGIIVNIPGYHNGYMYNIKLGGEIAFCLDPGKTLRNGALYTVKYSFQPSSPTEQAIAKAFQYGKSNYGDNVARVVAQTVIWVKSADRNTLIDAAEKATSSYGTSVQRQDIERHIDNILNTNISGKTFYVWGHLGNGTWQDLLTDIPGNNPPGDNENCSIEVVNELPKCEGNNKSNYGTIYQYAKGDCYSGYNKKENNYKSIYGQQERDYGDYCRMYCLKSFAETLPGNIARAIDVGRYIVWPNNNASNNNYKINANLATYPMITTLEKKCKISVDSAALKKDYNTQKSEMAKYAKEGGDKFYFDHSSDKEPCSELKEKVDSAKETYDTEETNYNTANSTYSSCSSARTECLKTSKNSDKDCASCSAPSSKAREDAKKAYEDLKTNYTACVNYKNAYEAAQGIIKEFNNCISADASTTLNYELEGARSEYNDPEYKGTFDLTSTVLSSRCDGCTTNSTKLSTDPRNVSTSNLLSKKDGIESRNIVATLTKRYDIAEYNGTYYYYINKDNLKYVNDTAGLANYTTIGFSNMPVSLNADPKAKYNLEIKINNVSGDASVFSSEISSNDYACYYKVKRNPIPTPCSCPEGTKHAGESLGAYLVNSNLTCSDAQLEYCDDSIPFDKYCIDTSSNVHIYTENDSRTYTEFLEQECPNGGSELTCPNDPSMDLTSCVDSGMTYGECVNTFCNNSNNPNNPNNPNKWVCPAGTNEGMDLTSCVLPMIIKGYSEQEAYEYCKDVTCPYKGIKIIYRVIDLTNPFPSKDADTTVTQTNLSIGMFNDELKGRYPGSNWNSTKVVRAKILENRSVDGDKVYNKEPLYTFIVNSENIKAIRNYNKVQHNSYSDFNLKCLMNNSAACKSYFVHDAKYGLVSGTCSRCTSQNCFYTCDD